MQRGIEYLRALSRTLVDPVSGQAIEAVPLSAIETEASEQPVPPLDRAVAALRAIAEGTEPDRIGRYEYLRDWVHKTAMKGLARDD